jgi:HSP20 family protein
MKFNVNGSVNPSHLNRDEFLTPFDKIFDRLMENSFPAFKQEVGLSHEKSAYPKVNVYDYDDKVGIIAEIPGLDKSNVSVDVEEGVLTIAGDKHGINDDGARCITRELKQSRFKRTFKLGKLLDTNNVVASFQDGMLSISIPKLKVKTPKKTSVKIS